MNSWINLRHYKIVEEKGQYRLYQLLSWRNISNYFLLPFIFGLGPRWTILDKSRVEMLNASGAIRIVTDTRILDNPRERRETMAWGALGGCLGPGIFGLILFNFLPPLDPLMHNLFLMLVLLVFIALLVSMNIRRHYETKLLQRLGLWGEFGAGDAASRALAQQKLLQRGRANASATRVLNIFILILGELILEVCRIFIIGFLLFGQYNLNQAIAFGFLFILFMLACVFLSGYPSNWLFVRRSAMTVPQSMT